MPSLIIDYNKLQESVSLIDNEINKLRELFNKQNSNFKLLEDNKKWFGTANKNCIEKYKELSGKYEEVLSELEKYKRFLLNVIESYNAVKNKVNNSSVLNNH